MSASSKKDSNDNTLAEVPPSSIVDKTANPETENVDAIVNSVPIKDYSDYDITIEEKTDYGDEALFSNENELASSLSTSSEVKSPAIKVNKETTKPTLQPQATTFTLDTWLTTANEPPCREADEISLTSLLKPINILKQTDFLQLKQQPAALVRRQRFSSRRSLKLQRKKARYICRRLPEWALPATTEALARLLKLQWRITDLVGYSLPARDQDLSWMKLAQGSSHKQHELKDHYHLKKDLFGKKSDQSKLDIAITQLTAIAKTRISAKTRQLHLQTTQQALIPILVHQVQRFQRKPSAAGDEKRLQMIESGRLVLKWLITGYRQLFIHYFQLPNWQYGRKRQDFYRVSQQLLDLIGLEQWFLQSCQRQVPIASRKILGAVFEVLEEIEPAMLEIEFQRQWRQQSLSLQQLQTEYLARELMNWHHLSSTRHQAASAALLSATQYLLPLSPEELPGLTVNSPVWYFRRDNEEQAKLQLFDRDAAPQRLLYLGHFFRYFLKLIEQQSVTADIADWLSANIRQLLQQQPTLNFHQYQRTDLVAIAGYASIYDWTQQRFYSLLSGSSADIRPPANSLQKKETKTRLSGDWQLANSATEDYWFLQTTEASNAVLVDCQQLLFFTNKTLDSDALAESVCLVVEDIRRDAGNKLQIAGRVLGRKALPLTLSTSTANPSVTALLLQQGAGNYHILTNSENLLAKRATLTMPDGQQLNCQLQAPHSLGAFNQYPCILEG